MMESIIIIVDAFFVIKIIIFIFEWHMFFFPSATCIWFNKKKKSSRDKYVAKHNAGEC